MTVASTPTVACSTFFSAAIRRNSSVSSRPSTAISTTPSTELK
jgi:hypothetical protein